MESIDTIALNMLFQCVCVGGHVLQGQNAEESNAVQNFVFVNFKITCLVASEELNLTLWLQKVGRKWVLL